MGSAIRFENDRMLRDDIKARRGTRLLYVYEHTWI